MKEFVGILLVAVAMTGCVMSDVADLPATSEEHPVAAEASPVSFGETYSLEVQGGTTSVFKVNVSRPDDDIVYASYQVKGVDKGARVFVGIFRVDGARAVLRANGLAVGPASFGNTLRTEEYVFVVAANDSNSDFALKLALWSDFDNARTDIDGPVIAPIAVVPQMRSFEFLVEEDAISARGFEYEESGVALGPGRAAYDLRAWLNTSVDDVSFFLTSVSISSALQATDWSVQERIDGERDSGSGSGVSTGSYRVSFGTANHSHDIAISYDSRAAIQSNLRVRMISWEIPSLGIDWAEKQLSGRWPVETLERPRYALDETTSASAIDYVRG